jgi:hypothetical protein
MTGKEIFSNLMRGESSQSDISPFAPSGADLMTLHKIFFTIFSRSR